MQGGNDRVLPRVAVSMHDTRLAARTPLCVPSNEQLGTLVSSTTLFCI